MSKTTIPTGGITADAINSTLIADDAINSEHYTDGSIDTAHIGDNQVTAAKATGVGTLVKIADGNTTGASANYVDVAGCFTSTYKIYKLFIYDVNTASDTALYMRWLTGTNTEQDGSNAYSYGISGYNSSNGGSNNGGVATYINLIGEDMRHDAGEHFAMEGTLYNPAGTSLRKRFNYHSGGRRTGQYTAVGVGSAEWTDNTAITGFRFLTNTGNLDSMYYVVYGVVI